MSHCGKARWLLSSIFLPTSKVTVKVCFLQALSFSKGVLMHLLTCHKYTDTLLLLSDKNPGKSQSKVKLLLHQVTLESMSYCITWICLRVITKLLGFGWRGWEVLHFGCIFKTGFSPSHSPWFLSLPGKHPLLLFRSAGGPFQHLGSIGFF